MGSVFSGRTGPRGGKKLVESLPRVTFQKSALVPLNGAQPLMTFEHRDVATVTYGPACWFSQGDCARGAAPPFGAHHMLLGGRAEPLGISGHWNRGAASHRYWWAGRAIKRLCLPMC